MRHELYLIPQHHAVIILAGIRNECEHQSWKLHAAHIRTNHVHVIVETSLTPERTMTALKAHATKLLRRSEKIGADRRIWARHGSTVSLPSLDAVRRAIAYVVDKQGKPIAAFQSGALDRGA